MCVYDDSTLLITSVKSAYVHCGGGYMCPVLILASVNCSFYLSQICLISLYPRLVAMSGSDSSDEYHCISWH